MVDETDLSTEKRWFYEVRARTAVTNLQKRHINAQYIPTQAEALAAVLEMIPEGATVVRGDSITVDQVGIIPALKKHNRNKVIDPFERDADGSTVAETREEWERMQKEAFLADVFLTGTNAVTLDGKLVNTDAGGNRVAPMIFGPNKVILVIGANKIVKDVDEAIERIRQVAAPMNAKRHSLKHPDHPEIGELPCVITGRCVDCRHDWRICNYTTIIEGALTEDKGRINVVLVGEELGI
jgi:hypothetical protein